MEMQKGKALRRLTDVQEKRDRGKQLPMSRDQRSQVKRDARFQTDDFCLMQTIQE